METRILTQRGCHCKGNRQEQVPHKRTPSLTGISDRKQTGCESLLSKPREMERFETKFHPHQAQYQISHDSVRRHSLNPLAPALQGRRASASDFNTHNTRRSSGLTLLYKPNKPDIDLVRDFKQSLHAPASQARKLSSPCLPSLGPLQGASTLSLAAGEASLQRRRNSSFIPGSGNQPMRPELDL